MHRHQVEHARKRTQETLTRPHCNNHQKGLALCLDAPPWASRHIGGSRARTPTEHRCPRGKAVGGPQHDPQCDKRAQPKRQTQLSLTRHMAAEPCSVQFSSARIQQRTEQVVQRRQEVDGQFVGSRQQQRQRTQGNTPGRRTRFRSEELIDKVQKESSHISWKTNSSQPRTRVTHHQHSRGGKVRYHSRAGRSQSTDRKCNVGLVMNQRRTISKLFRIIMKTVQRKNPFIQRTESGDPADQDSPDSVRRETRFTRCSISTGLITRCKDR